MRLTRDDPAVTIRDALHAATQRLDAARIDAPRVVTESLLAHSLHCSRAQLLARLHDSLPADRAAAFHALVTRCASGEPFAYVVGHREFYALDFHVDSRVLIPRPETELLVDTAIGIARARRAAHAGDYAIADIGTGSGAIAVSLAVHLPFARVTATDISPDAVDVAGGNARRHGVSDRITFAVGDLLAPLAEPVDLLVANLPYVRSKECEFLSQTIRDHEPAVAFDGGPDGLAFVKQLLQGAPRVLRDGGAILLEIGAAHGDAAVELARDEFPSAHISLHTDPAGLDRLLVIQTGQV